MKLVNKISLLIVCLFIGTINISGQTKTTKSNEKVVFNVSMTCENCQRKKKKNIAFESGVKDMKVNLKKKTVTIIYNSNQTTIDKLIESFAILGYEASVDTKFTNCTCKMGTDCETTKHSSTKIPCKGNCNKQNTSKQSSCC